MAMGRAYSQDLRERVMAAVDRWLLRTSRRRHRPPCNPCGTQCLVRSDFELAISRDDCEVSIPEARHRRHFVKARVRVHAYWDGSLALFHGPRKIASYAKDGALAEDGETMGRSRKSTIGPGPEGVEPFACGAAASAHPAL